MVLMTRHASAFLLASMIPANLPAQAVTWWDKDFDAAKDKPADLVVLYCWHGKHDTCAAMFGGTMSNADGT